MNKGNCKFFVENRICTIHTDLQISEEQAAVARRYKHRVLELVLPRTCRHDKQDRKMITTMFESKIQLTENPCNTLEWTTRSNNQISVANLRHLARSPLLFALARAERIRCPKAGQMARDRDRPATLFAPDNGGKRLEPTSSREKNAAINYIDHNESCKKRIAVTQLNTKIRKYRGKKQENLFHVIWLKFISKFSKLFQDRLRYSFMLTPSNQSLCRIFWQTLKEQSNSHSRKDYS